MYINGAFNSSNPDAEKLAKIIDLTTQTSQANDSILREIQDTTAYLNITDPKKLEELVKDGITLFQIILKNYDDITVQLAAYKSQLNDQIIDPQTP